MDCKNIFSRRACHYFIGLVKFIVYRHYSLALWAREGRQIRMNKLFQNSVKLVNNFMHIFCQSALDFAHPTLSSFVTRTSRS
jgi:hypothetical protein